MKHFRNAFFATMVTCAILMVFVGCTQLTEATEKPASRPIEIVEQTEGFAVMEDGKKVLFYQRKPKSLRGKYTRCHYIHPLYGLDGQVLTEDFPRDHLHQRGIFWAWHQLLVGGKPVGDGWVLENFSQDVDNVEILREDSKSACLKTRVFWKSPNYTDDKGRQKPFIEETTVIRIHRTEGDIRKIDFEIGLLALADDVRIGGSDNEKGYGGFSPRIKTPKGLVFTGQKGSVKPKNVAVEAGPYVDFSGDFDGDGKVSGIAVLCHKSIPGYPRPWILRRRASMQNPVYPGRNPVALSAKEPLVLRYRLVIHRGDAAQIDLDKLQAEYNAETF